MARLDQGKSGDKLRQRGEIRRALAGWFVACLVACLGFGAAPAVAGTGELWLKSFEFDGADTNEGKFTTAGAIAIDQKSGTVYVIDQFRGVIDKFDLDGKAKSFAATGKSSLDPYLQVKGFPESANFGLHDLTVDSYGANAGRIYVSYNEKVEVEAGKFEVPPVRLFAPTGEALACDLKVALGVSGLAVDVQGGLWIGSRQTERADSYNSDACPPALLDSVNTGPIDELGCDANGNLYVLSLGGLRRLFKHENVCASHKPDPDKALLGDEIHDFAIDQSSTEGHVFALRESDEGFAEFSAEEEIVGDGFGKGELAGATRIAHYAHPTDGKEDRVYVAKGGTVMVFEKTPVTTPDIALDPVSEFGADTAKFSGTINPLGKKSSYHFEWKRLGQSWAEALESPEEVLPSEEKDFAVSHKATGLPPATVFNVRIVATNTDLGVKEISAERSFSNIAATVETIAAAPRTQTTARINARVNSSANPTTVYFELSSDGGASWTQLPDHQVGEGASTAVTVGEELSSLNPGTTYHYRAFAENELGPALPQGGVRSFTTRLNSEALEVEPSECPNEDARSAQHSTYLGSCRAIELVNTPDKGNQSAGADRMRSDGERALWATGGGSPGGNSGSGDAFLAKRTPPAWDAAKDPSGWVSKTLIPPAAEQVGGGDLTYNMLLSSPELSCFVFRVNRDEAGPVLVRIGEDQGQEVLREYAKPPPNGNFKAAMSDDCSQVLALDREVAPEQLEEVGSGKVEVLSIMPDGDPSACGLDTEGAATGFLGGLWRSGYRMAAADASLVYFSTSPNGSCSDPPGLYLRDREADATTLVALGASGQGVDFIRASEDGRFAYYATHGNCRRYSQPGGTCEESEAADTNGHRDVYRWDQAKGESACLTCVVPDADIEGKAVLVSDDLSHVYFESKKQLLAGEGKAGDLNLYVLSDEEVLFIAEMGSGGALGGTPLLSANGEVLAFKANPNPSLTADAIATQCPNAEGASAPCAQLYRYENGNESLECVSCARDRETTVAANLESGFRMSADGSTIAFSSAETLDPIDDINGDADLYEWRRGERRLITDGETTFPKKFAAPRIVEVDATGRSIYFGVVDPGLSGFERDGLSNLYVARIGGGFIPPSPEVHCVEDSCQGPLVPAPPAEHPASADFKGRGNVKGGIRKRPCAKKRGAAKRRCAKRQHRRAQKARAEGRRRAGR